MATGDRLPPTDDTTVTEAPAPSLVPKTASPISRATEFLYESSRIATLRTHYDKYRRYVNLNVQDMFDSLVSLYSGIFQMQWQHFRRFMDQFTSPPGVQPYVYAARVYISMWFIDLYVSNREAVKKISSLAFNERYRTEVIYISQEYDTYLSLLNASIRPTHVKLIMEDVLYIPILADQINANDASHNYFNINNFAAEEECFYGLLLIMHDRKHWNFRPLSHDTLGRPCWLFDWHSDDRVCAWFHMEGNFNLDDVTLAYILGVACTPKLGPRDIDDWQFFPNATVPVEQDPNNFQRLTSRRFFGSYEVRTLDVDTDHFLPTTTAEVLTAQKKKKSKDKRTSKAAGKRTATETESGSPHDEEAEGSQPTEVAAPRYRIVDWTYYYLVVLKTEAHTRTGALRIVSLS